jgi:pimeloyl-ACP methyl ester carboxylesterase
VVHPPHEGAIEPARVEVPDEALGDLRTRLLATRWPEPEPVTDWSQGVPLAYLQELCRYWAQDYDWRAREAALNRFAQYRTVIDEVSIHFIHIRSPQPGALPLLLTHGWPTTIAEFVEIIWPLSDPAAHGASAADAFHVVCPALPGYPLSGKPQRTGWTVEHIADAWAQLMSRLGYTAYGAHGGDWGASVTTAVGGQDPEHCIGIHVTMPLAPPPPDLNLATMTDAEREALAARRQYERWESGYSKQQSTRPQTIGYALTDSPAGQAAWIVEKFWAWTDSDDNPESAVSRDQMLDQITLYWVTASAASSARLYWESFRSSRQPVAVPTGVASFPRQIWRTPRSWARQTYPQLLRWTDMPRGGHFAAMEAPELLVDDLRAFFRLVRDT